MWWPEQASPDPYWDHTVTAIGELGVLVASTATPENEARGADYKVEGYAHFEDIKRAPEPFFEVGKTYEYTLHPMPDEPKMRVQHIVTEMDGRRIAVGLNQHGYFARANMFDHWMEI